MTHILQRMRRRLDGEGGFTIVEAMVSLTVLSVGAFAVAHAMIFGLSTTGLSRQKLAARAALDQQMEEARALNYDNLVLSDPDPGLTHSSDPTNPDYWVNQAAQKYDPDGSGPLAEEDVVRVAGASPALQHYQNPLVNGSTTYSVYRYAMWADSPTDGCVTVTSQCAGSTPDKADGNSDGVSDADGHDQKRVVITVTWNDQLGRGTSSLSESSLFADGKIIYQAPVKNTAPTVSCPTVSTLPYEFVSNGGYMAFQVQASDPDGSISSIGWTIKNPDGSVYWSDANGGATPTVQFPLTDATYPIVNSVTDNGGSVSTNSALSCTVQTPDLVGNGGPDETMTVNGGATYTTSQVVTLTFSKAHNPVYFQTSTDGLTWAAKQPFSTTTSLTLTSGDGTKWVYARFYDSAGKYGAAVWKSITLDTGPPSAPTNLKVASSSTSGANKTLVLTWTTPTGVTDLGGYRLYSRIITSTGSFNLICTTATTSCSATTKKTDSYQYYVVAYDIAGNVSAASNSITA